ncbi:MAG: hypothetical protein ACHREM_26910, partial [Polyangiales bacterium]
MSDRARLVIARVESIDARALCDVATMLRSLRGDHEAALLVAPIVGEAIALGRFQRRASTLSSDFDGAIVARGTGGVAISVGEGQLLV